MKYLCLVGYVYRENSRIPNYYDGWYWTMWKLPMFGCREASQVLHEIQDCKEYVSKCLHSNTLSASLLSFRSPPPPPPKCLPAFCYVTCNLFTFVECLSVVKNKVIGE